MAPVISKVFAYITHRNRLLVFRHTDFPEAGIQVPAGTLKTNEDLVAAVLREAQEETGLRELTVKRALGEQIRNMQDVGKDEIQCPYHGIRYNSAASRPINGSTMRPIRVTAARSRSGSNSSGQPFRIKSRN